MMDSWKVIIVYDDSGIDSACYDSCILFLQGNRSNLTIKEAMSQIRNNIRCAA